MKKTTSEPLQNESLFSLDGDDAAGQDHSTPAASARTQRDEFLGWLGAMEAAGRIFLRKASLGRCPQCRARVLNGLDADLLALPVTVDPTPLTLKEWRACELVGRSLFTLRNDGERWTINDLDPYAWPGSKHRDAIVVPGHECGARFPGRLVKLTERHNRTQSDAPPF